MVLTVLYVPSSLDCGPDGLIQRVRTILGSVYSEGPDRQLNSNDSLVPRKAFHASITSQIYEDVVNFWQYMPLKGLQERP